VPAGTGDPSGTSATSYQGPPAWHDTGTTRGDEPTRRFRADRADPLSVVAAPADQHQRLRRGGRTSSAPPGATEDQRWQDGELRRSSTRRKRPCTRSRNRLAPPPNPVPAHVTAETLRAGSRTPALAPRMGQLPVRLCRRCSRRSGCPPNGHAQPRWSWPGCARMTRGSTGSKWWPRSAWAPSTTPPTASRGNCHAPNAHAPRRDAPTGCVAGRSCPR
jgi:hypothetical protein